MALKNTEEIRCFLNQEKITAVAQIKIELDGMINRTKFTKKYFNKSQSWMAKKLNACMTLQEEKAFTPKEYEILVSAFRDMASLLNKYADDIEKAK